MKEFVKKIVSNDLTDRGFYMSDEAMADLKVEYNSRPYPVFYSHNYDDIRQYVGYTIPGSFRVENNTLVGAFKTLDTEAGKIAEKLLEDKEVPMGVSVGIKIDDYEYVEESGLMMIKSASPLEFSITPIPTDKNTFDDVILNLETGDGIMAEEVVTSFAKWDRAYINSLPNSSFAVIEKDYLEGKIKDKRARHLPFKDKDGNVDLPHLRNALARMNQIEPVGESETAEELRERAKKVLIPYAKKYLPNSKWAKKEGYSMDVEKMKEELSNDFKKFLSEEKKEEVKEEKNVEEKVEEKKEEEVKKEEEKKDEVKGEGKEEENKEEEKEEGFDLSSLREEIRKIIKEEFDNALKNALKKYDEEETVVFSVVEKKEKKSDELDFSDFIVRK